MTSLLRMGVVVVGVIAAAASATAPKQHTIEATIVTSTDFETTWAALGEVFSELGWPAQVRDRDSGVVETDWLILREGWELYTDCGDSGSTRTGRAQLRMTVSVRPAKSGTKVLVDTMFRQPQVFANHFAFVECSSRGTIEAMILKGVASKKALPPGAVRNPSNDPQRAVAYWCSESDGVCYADEKACDGRCDKFADEVWCTRYASVAGHGFLCSVSKTACLLLRGNPMYRRGRQEFGECVAQKPGHAARTVTDPPPPPPRGYFCASSASAPNAGFCTREKADCLRSREAALAAVADLAACRLVEGAFCYEASGAERCAPTMAACTARAGSQPCAERQ